MKKLYKLVFVVGNGFDMDLKLDTSYKSFINSLDFKKHIQNNIVNDLKNEAIRFKKLDISSRKKLNYIPQQVSVFNLLAAKSSLENWYDIEKQLAIIAHNGLNISNSIENHAELLDLLSITEESFYQLHSALGQYLSHLSYASIAHNSTAYYLFRVLNKYPSLVQVSSFNYTDFDLIFPDENQLRVDHIHGRLKDNSLIIGIQDDIEIDSTCNYMIKSFSEHFRSHNLIYDLEDADEIIFFGHSLGETDYHYFEDLFQRQTVKSSAKKDLRLSIFTYNEESRMNILQQLRNMNHKRTDYLFALCNFQLFMTDHDCGDTTRITCFLRDLDSRLKSNNAYILEA